MNLNKKIIFCHHFLDKGKFLVSTPLQVARTIYYGFQSMFADFQGVTLGARARFEQSDWTAVQQAQKKRIDVYRAKVEQLVPQVQQVGGEALKNIEVWEHVRSDFAQLIMPLANADIAESFYNSVIGKLYAHEYIDDRYAFITPSVDVFSMARDPLLIRSYQLDRHWRETVRQLLLDYQFNVDYSNLDKDQDFLINSIKESFPDVHLRDETITVNVLEAVFYRNKGAYIVGCIEDLGQSNKPFLIALMNKENGVYVDALITNPEEVSVIFSFTRAYFMVDSPVPAHIVAFLGKMMPHKKRFELYASIGFRKHAKTDLYRDMMMHLSTTTDQFVEAPGIRGMVMLVFTLPSYDAVFKLIKDKFTPPKEVTEKIVREKYFLVTKHDRVGRMADTQEFNGMRLPRERFSQELLDILLKFAPSKVTVTETDVIIQHMYTERRMVPLNMYLSDASEGDINIVMQDYGQAIKDLAAANIFPGDMLLKNFGVTRHKRVIFYDYDELCYLTDCNFRSIPEPKTEEQEMSSTPWYNVAPEDVFPEEFRLFFSGNPKARKAFEEYHSDLYGPELWQSLQRSVSEGIVADVYPYRR